MREGKKEKEAQAGMTAYWSRLLTSKPAGMCRRLFPSCTLLFLRLLACFFFLWFFFFFFCLFFWWLLFSFLYESLDPTNNNTKQTASTAAILLLLFVAAATMQYPTTSATRNPWLPVVQPRCDLGRPYQDRVARQRNLGRPLPLPQQIHHRHLSLSFVLLSVLSAVAVGFFFLMIWNPIFQTACLWNLLPKRTPQIPTNFHGL